MLGFAFAVRLHKVVRRAQVVPFDVLGELVRQAFEARRNANNGSGNGSDGGSGWRNDPGSSGGGNSMNTGVGFGAWGGESGRCSDADVQVGWPHVTVPTPKNVTVPT